jgi:hypothetical protein
MSQLLYGVAYYDEIVMTFSSVLALQSGHAEDRTLCSTKPCRLLDLRNTNHHTQTPRSSVAQIYAILGALRSPSKPWREVVRRLQQRAA